MAEHGYRNGWNGLEWLEIAGNGWKWLEWQKMDENGWIPLERPEMARHAGNGWKWLVWLTIAGNGRKLLECTNSLITYLLDILIQMDFQGISWIDRYLLYCLPGKNI